MAIDQACFFDNQVFSRMLKGGRRRQDLTLDQLSALTKEIDPAGEGVSRMTLSRYETGATLPGLRELRILSFALRMPLAWLVYEDREDPMTSYKLNLEMRITETVFDMVTAEGIIKGENQQDPQTPEYLALVEQSKLKGNDIEKI